MDPAEPGAPGSPTSADHHGLIAFLGVLALVLLFVGAVGAAGLGSRDDRQADAPDQGNAQGQQDRAEKQQQRAERQAEKREQQRERKEQQRELKEQRRQSGVLGPQVAETLTDQTGTIALRTSADGTTAYVLETATGVLVLDVGPARYWGDNYPLPPLVGTTVTVMGVQQAGSDEFSVFVIGDRVIRGPGRPPWAGGSTSDGHKAPTNSPIPSPSPTTGPSPSP
jgi:hypothetical protein